MKNWPVALDASKSLPLPILGAAGRLPRHLRSERNASRFAVLSAIVKGEGGGGRLAK